MQSAAVVPTPQPGQRGNHPVPLALSGPDVHTLPCQARGGDGRVGVGLCGHLPLCLPLPVPRGFTCTGKVGFSTSPSSLRNPHSFLHALTHCLLEHTLPGGPAPPHPHPGCPGTPLGLPSLQWRLPPSPSRSALHLTQPASVLPLAEPSLWLSQRGGVCPLVVD